MFAVLGAAAVALLGAPASALAAGDAGDLTTGREITRYDATIDLGSDGVAQVTVDFDFDFGDDPGHGPYLTLPTRQSVDPTQDRLFRVTDIEASSSSGAPADLDVEDDGDALVLRIGDEDVDDVDGVQSYRLTYTVDGLLNPASPQHSGDELYWNVIGSGWEVPLSRVSARVTGPAEVEGAACFAGPQGSTDACDSASSDGQTAVYTQSTVPVGEQLTVVTGWPGGTFPGVEPILTAPYDALAPLRPAPVTGGIAAALLVGGGALALRRVRRTGRDQAYLGLTPGLRPASGQEGAIGLRDRRAPVAVQFTPPAGVRPGEVGTLVDEKADTVDVTATLVDLAVRGFLRIEEVPRSDPNKRPKDWTLVATPGGSGALLPFEQLLLSEVFAGRESVKLSDLRATFATSMGKVQDSLYEHVTSVGWFRANPKNVRTAWLAGGIALGVVGLGAAIAMLAIGFQVRGLGWLAIAVLLLGLLVTLLAGAAPARTAAGTAVLAEAMGFRSYLATAEAEQLRFEEGEDIFSRYLPYAIVFGLTERWARVFADLAAQGHAVAQPSWYTGYHAVGGVYWATAFAGSMDRFQSIATTSLSAPTPGSGGSSGFSGGFSGGGVGGGGGGGW